MKKTKSLTASDRRKLEAERDKMRQLVAQYEDNGIFDTVYHDTLARVEAALEKDDKGQQVRRARRQKNDPS